jgi:hypothetical protein
MFAKSDFVPLPIAALRPEISHCTFYPCAVLVVPAPVYTLLEPVDSAPAGPREPSILTLYRQTLVTSYLWAINQQLPRSCQRMRKKYQLNWESLHNKCIKREKLRNNLITGLLEPTLPPSPHVTKKQEFASIKHKVSDATDLPLCVSTLCNVVQWNCLTHFSEGIRSLSNTWLYRFYLLLSLL